MDASWSRVVTLARSNAGRIAIWTLAVVIIVAAVFGWLVTHPLSGTEASIASVRADDQVALSQHDGTYVLEPANDEPTAGLVFYPGALVTPDAYLASLSPLVSQTDIAVYVPRMPLNLAVFDSGAASGVVAEHPQIDRWFVGGHSLGGAAACRYASNHRAQVEGLVLFGSFCRGDVTPNVSTVSVTGSADTILANIPAANQYENLPANATVVEIQGMNHSQFGSYTGQRGDQQASIGYQTAHERLADVIVPWFGNRTTQQPTRSFVTYDRREPSVTPRD